MTRRLTIILLVTGFILASWAFYFEPSIFRIREEVITVPRWPADCNDLRIAILADLHVGSPYKGLDSLRSLVDRINRAGPDLILLPGDFVIQGVVGGTFVEPEAAGAVLAELAAPLGVFAVLGNHDWWLDARRVERALSNNGIGVLEDASRRIGAGTCRIELVGISDFWEGPHNIEKAMANVDDIDNVVAFTHNPDVFPQIPSRVVLTIAGHTHGGQVYFPLIGRPIVPSIYGERYAIGHIVENGKHLYVSPGIGTSIIPVRFLVPPEGTILRVTNADQDAT